MGNPVRCDDFGGKTVLVEGVRHSLNEWLRLNESSAPRKEESFKEETSETLKEEKEIDYNSLTVAELKMRIRELGGKIEGKPKKADLIDTLINL